MLHGGNIRFGSVESSLIVLYRFDKLVYVGVSRDKESQLKIITALTRKYVQSLTSAE